jgi:DNA-binding response OmpR family regulator
VKKLWGREGNTMVNTDQDTSTVLLIEDNAGDVILVQEALKEIPLAVHLAVARDGEEAMRYLQQEPPPAETSPVDLIILDINLPKKDGFEVLKDIKSIPALKNLPVVVFTTSRSDKDILKTYGMGATCMLTKPLGFYEFIESIKSILSTCLR